MKKKLLLLFLLATNFVVAKDFISIHCFKGPGLIWNEQLGGYEFGEETFEFHATKENGFNGPVKDSWSMNDFTHSMDWIDVKKGSASARTYKNKSNKKEIEIVRAMGATIYTFNISNFDKKTNTATLKYRTNVERRDTYNNCNVSGERRTSLY